MMANISRKGGGGENKQQGKSYNGRSFDKVDGKFIEIRNDGKIIGERCQCTDAFYQCKDLTDEDRNNKKEVYVRMVVEAKDVKERRGN